jgi:hypothetical protein
MGNVLTTRKSLARARGGEGEMDELQKQIGQEVHVSMTHDKGQKGKLVSIDDRGLLLFMDLTHQTNKAPSRFYFCPWTNIIWIDWPEKR